MTITSGNKVLISANVNVGTGADDYGRLLVTDGSNNIIYQKQKMNLQFELDDQQEKDLHY